MRRLAVLGAGISGLTLAWLLKNKNPHAEVIVLEKSGRAGGWIDTRQEEGFLFEMGPRSLRAKGKGVYSLRLIEQLGLQNEVIAADRAAKIRYVYEGGALQPLPHSLPSFLFSPFLPMFLKAAFRDWNVRPGAGGDETIFSFAVRHFGDEVAERLIDPLTLGIFATDCRRLSVDACFPLWSEWDRSHGSLIKAAFAAKRNKGMVSPWIESMQKEAIFSFKDGMATLVRALTQRLGSAVHYNSGVEKLHFLPDGVELELADDRKIAVDHVYSTLPASEAHKLLDIKALQTLSASVAVAAIGFNKQILKRKGFGYLVPTKEKEDILGMVWDSSAFPQQNSRPEQTRLSVMIDAQIPRDFKNIALEALARHLHIDQQPDFIEVKVAASAIPQYPVGHRRAMEDMRERCKAQYPHLTLLGTAFGGVAVNDCIAQAFSTAGVEE